MKAALYARVSTTDKGQDPGMQLEEMRRFAAARGWTCREYVDRGVSGSKASRPALDELMAAVRSRQVDVVVVWKLDRLGRSLAHLLHLLNDFTALGVSFVSLRESIDLTTPTGKLMLHLFGAFAEFERSLIQERVRAGIANAKRKGKRVGRPGVAPADRDAVLDLYAADPQLSIRAIAGKTKLSASSVQRIIANEHRDKAETMNEQTDMNESI